MKGCVMSITFYHNHFDVSCAASERFEKAAKQLATWKHNVDARHIGRFAFKVDVFSCTAT